MHIAHHVTNRESVAAALTNYQQLKESATHFVKEKDPFDMKYLSQSAADVFFCKAYLGEDEPNIALRDYVESLAARLLFSIHPNEEISYSLNGDLYSIAPADRDYGVSMHLWNMAFFGAVLLGDSRIISSVTEMDVDKLLEATKKAKNYTFSMARALQAFYRKEKGYPDLLTKALEENSQVPKDSLLHDKALDIDGPPLELLYLFLIEDSARFNDSLKEALEWHRKYHQRLEKKGMADNSGLVSLPICCMVKLAKKIKGFTPEHTSDYMPEYLIKV